MSGEKVKCPKCGAEDQHPTYVHDWGTTTIEEVKVRVFGFGWECLACGHRWGYFAEFPSRE